MLLTKREKWYLRLTKDGCYEASTIVSEGETGYACRVSFRRSHLSWQAMYERHDKSCYGYEETSVNILQGGEEIMVITIAQSNQILFPESLAPRLRGKTFELVETKEGFLLKPVDDAIRLARGCLKGSRLSSERFMQLKQEEKERER